MPFLGCVYIRTGKERCRLIRWYMLGAHCFSRLFQDRFIFVNHNGLDVLERFTSLKRLRFPLKNNTVRYLAAFCLIIESSIYPGRVRNWGASISTSCHYTRGQINENSHSGIPVNTRQSARPSLRVFFGREREGDESLDPRARENCIVGRDLRKLCDAPRHDMEKQLNASHAARKTSNAIFVHRSWSRRRLDYRVLSLETADSNISSVAHLPPAGGGNARFFIFLRR